jgi:hypothetical protein
VSDNDLDTITHEEHDQTRSTRRSQRGMAATKTWRAVTRALSRRQLAKKFSFVKFVTFVVDRCSRAQWLITRVGVRLDIGGAVGVARRSHFFDNHDAFVLDIIKISPIIYIWYEGGWLSPPVVTTRAGVRG